MVPELQMLKKFLNLSKGGSFPVENFAWDVDGISGRVGHGQVAHL